MMIKKLRSPPLVRVLLQTLTAKHIATTATATATDTNLYHRLVRVREPSVVPVLDRWVGEGKAIDQQDLHIIIKQLRKFGRYKHALQICQWMSKQPYLDVSHTNVSLELDLISKVYGMEKAEDYFNNLPNTSRVWQVYGALLNCYANAKSLEKAEATMQKLRELGYNGSLTYNVMMGLYSATQNYNKLDLLMEEMEQKGIRIDKFAYNIRLNAYTKTLEIEKMEKLLLKMEVDPEMTLDWHVYTIMANGYLKSGAKDKALIMLKKSEYLIRPSQRMVAYQNLLTFYASAGRKDEVFRVWNLYKNLGMFYNHGYLCLLSSLAKLDCIDDVERIYNEWETESTSFDFQVPNLVITFYCKKGLMEKAEILVKKVIESGKVANSSTWSRMAWGYVKNGDMENAVEAMRKSILGSVSGWTVDTLTLCSCLEYLDQKGKLDEAKEIMKLLQEKGHLSDEVYMGLMKKLSKKSVMEILA